MKEENIILHPRNLTCVSTPNSSNRGYTCYSTKAHYLAQDILIGQLTVLLLINRLPIETHTLVPCD